MTVTRLLRVTPEEAARGIYFDYEGNEEAAPAVLGWCCEESVRHFIVDPALAPYASLENPKHAVSVAPLEDALGRMVELARREDRRIFGFTMHEVHVTEQYCRDRATSDWICENYLNAKRYIDRWVRRLVQAGAIEEPESRALVSLMPLVGMRYTPGRGPGTVGPGLTRLRGQLRRHASAADTSPGSRRHWWRVIGHNATDVLATQMLTSAAVTGLDRRTR